MRVNACVTEKFIYCKVFDESPSMTLREEQTNDDLKEKKI